MADVQTARDGFVVYDADGRELHFVPCSYHGRLRDRVAAGLAAKVDFDRGQRFADTRDLPPDKQ